MSREGSPYGDELGELTVSILSIVVAYCQMEPNPYALQPGSLLKTQLRDRVTGNQVSITVQNIDLYRFFLRTRIDELKPHYLENGSITNNAANWQIMDVEPLNVIGSSHDGEFFYFYVETETQTKARVTFL